MVVCVTTHTHTHTQRQQTPSFLRTQNDAQVQYFKFVFALYLLLTIQQWSINYVKSYVFVSQGIWLYEVHVVPACHILCVISADCFALKCPAFINIHSWSGQKFVLRVC